VSATYSACRAVRARPSAMWYSCRACTSAARDSRMRCSASSCRASQPLVPYQTLRSSSAESSPRR
jgi:hypothetical protein